MKNNTVTKVQLGKYVGEGRAMAFQILKTFDVQKSPDEIVCAINSHDEMLVVLKEIAVCAESNCVNVAALELVVKQTIAKAEGK